MDPAKSNNFFLRFIANSILFIVTLSLLVVLLNLLFGLMETKHESIGHYIGKDQRIKETKRCDENSTWLKNASTPMRRPNLTCGWYAPNFSTNSFGIRNADYPISKTKKRIVFIGDSVTEGYGLYASERYSEVLERRLNNSYEIWNAGVGGTNLQDYLDRLELSLLNLSPDIVIVAITENDYAIPYNLDKFDNYFQANSAVRSVPKVFPVAASFHEQQASKSPFYRSLCIWVYNMVVNFKYSQKRYQYEKSGIYHDIAKINKFSSLAKEYNFTLILVLMPYLNEHYKPIGLLRTNNFNITIVDILPFLKANQSNLYSFSIENYYFETEDYIHLNPEANQIVADVLFQTLISLNLTGT